MFVKWINEIFEKEEKEIKYCHCFMIQAPLEREKTRITNME